MSGIFSILLKFISLALKLEEPLSFPPPLKKDVEAELFERMAGGDKDARSKLIEHNLRLVSHIIRKYYASYESPEELLSIGSIGLVKAVDSFCAENGARFATYAAKCIQNAILSQRNQDLFSALTKEIKMRYRTGVAFLFPDLFCYPVTHYRRFLTSAITASISASFSSAEQFSLSM